MAPLTLSQLTARRFVLGRQGLWPGRRWTGLAGVAEAIRIGEAVQLDTLQIVARSQDIALHSRIQAYQPDQLHHVAYEDRQFFDYGGCLYLYPMPELSFWRTPMRRRALETRWANFAAGHTDLIEEVLAEISNQGPKGNRGFTGRKRVNSYRGGKDTALALYYLWLTGELMIHHRERFERVYDLHERVAPPELDFIAEESAAERFFARKIIAFYGLITERGWRSGFADFIARRVGTEEATNRIAALVAEGVVTRCCVEGSKERWLVLTSDVPTLSLLEAGQTPDAWKPLDATTLEEVTFLAPLEIVSARGRSRRVFDFEYIWEVYKPVEQRRWGYYVLPILYGDRLVARLDPKLDRTTMTLQINGFWLEDDAPALSPEFGAALAHGLHRFAIFLNARGIQIDSINPAKLRTAVRKQLGGVLEVVPEIK